MEVTSVPRKSLPIYDLRGTMYELNASTPAARGCEAGADRMSQSRDRTWLQRSGERKMPPMYDCKIPVPQACEPLKS